MGRSAGYTHHCKRRTVHQPESYTANFTNPAWSFLHSRVRHAVLATEPLRYIFKCSVLYLFLVQGFFLILEWNAHFFKRMLNISNVRIVFFGEFTVHQCAVVELKFSHCVFKQCLGDVLVCFKKKKSMATSWMVLVLSRSFDAVNGLSS